MLQMQFHIFKAEIILLHSVFFNLCKKSKMFKEVRSDKTVEFKTWKVVFSEADLS